MNIHTVRLSRRTSSRTLERRVVALLLWWLFLLGIFDENNNHVGGGVTGIEAAATQPPTVQACLEAGDSALAQGDLPAAIAAYQVCIPTTFQPDQVVASTDDNKQKDTTLTLLELWLSLYTNVATAYSEWPYDNDNDQHIQQAMEYYQRAIRLYQHYDSQTRQTGTNQQESPQETSCRQIAAQACFYLGMVHQDLPSNEDNNETNKRNHISEALDAYRQAQEWDPYHWAAYANAGSLFHDQVRDFRRALQAYNQAYTILTQQAPLATDPPPHVEYVLSQLQYRIGLCIAHDPTQTCALPKQEEGGGGTETVQSTDNTEENNETEDDTVVVVDCQEMAAHAFSLAVKYDDTNESAKHMLATLTADATMKRASNEYVQTLFDDYASNFEHSLVQELHYTGFERLRRGFDRAMYLLEHQKAVSMDTAVPSTTRQFAKVLDAGCGTGLVGEQFRNISHYLMGVDLSEAILQQAQTTRPNLYQELVAGDLIQVLEGPDHAQSLDLIIAADSYIYFGDLDPLFAAMVTGLVPVVAADSPKHSPNAFVAFTLENVSNDTEARLAVSKPDWRWQLTASGRFAHSKDCKFDSCIEGKRTHVSVSVPIIFLNTCCCGCSLLLYSRCGDYREPSWFAIDSLRAPGQFSIRTRTRRSGTPLRHGQDREGLHHVGKG